MKSRREHSSGLTLVEIIVVVAIILVVAALSTGPIIRAKQAGKRGAATSNLRQCYVALSLYAEDHGGLPVLPPLASARGVVQPGTDRDPADHWIREGSEPLDPLVGSFAYIRGAVPFDNEDSYRTVAFLVESGAAFKMMVSVFHGSEKVSYDPWGFPATPKATAPDKLLALYYDGRIKLVQRSNEEGIGYGWGSLFLPLDWK